MLFVGFEDTVVEWGSVHCNVLQTTGVLWLVWM